MLVVTRKIGQQILICDGSIQMKILKVNGGSISIGINAPKHIDIDREEVFLRKRATRSILPIGGI